MNDKRHCEACGTGELFVAEREVEAKRIILHLQCRRCGLRDIQIQERRQDDG